MFCRSLGKFQPSVLDAGRIREELSAWLEARGVTDARNRARGKPLPIGVRSPAERPDDPVISQWHRDGLTDALDHRATPQTRWLIVWSNGTPTELQDGDGWVFAFEPGDVILVDNQYVWHRQPPPEEGRWFARLLDPEFSSASAESAASASRRGSVATEGIVA